MNFYTAGIQGELDSTISFFIEAGIIVVILIAIFGIPLIGMAIFFIGKLVVYTFKTFYKKYKKSAGSRQYRIQKV